MSIQGGIGSRRERADVDTQARTQLATLARQLASGAITNRAFERSLPHSHDSAVHEVYAHGLWPLYDDLIEHRLAGPHALTAQQHAEVARITLFLRSELPYRYPRTTLRSLLSRLVGRWRRPRTRGVRWDQGDTTVWPFYSREEYLAVLASLPVTAETPAP